MTEKHAFIDAEYANALTESPAPAVLQMCRWLEVSKPGFYEWRSRPESATARRRADLAALIARVFEDSDATYGYRQIAAQLARSGIAAGAELVRKVMRELGLAELVSEDFDVCLEFSGRVSGDEARVVAGQAAAGSRAAASRLVTSWSMTRRA